MKEGGELPAWTKRRCDVAASLYAERDGTTCRIFTTSRGTTWKPPPLNTTTGFPIDESEALMRYLVTRRGVPSADVYQENVALDTIGNAFFLRALHFDFFDNLAEIIVVTSAFHMPRSRAIFEWVMRLPRSTRDDRSIRISFVESDDGDMDSDVREARARKESASLEHLISQTIPRIRSLPDLHRFIFNEHDAYKNECRYSSSACLRRGHPPAGDEADILINSY